MWADCRRRFDTWIAAEVWLWGSPTTWVGYFFTPKHTLEKGRIRSYNAICWHTRALDHWIPLVTMRTRRKEPDSFARIRIAHVCPIVLAEISRSAQGTFIHGKPIFHVEASSLI